MTEETLPREELLRKMLNMTTSSNDGQALVAIRKANALLEGAGWSWDKLLAGKIRIVENPFKNIPNPKRTESPSSFGASFTAAPPPTQPQAKGRAPSPTTRPRSGCRWEYDAFGDCWVNTNAPTQQRQWPPQNLGLSKKNLYGGHCYCCGDYVDNEKGFILKPSDKNPAASSKWAVCCAACNKNGSHVPKSAAPKQTGQTTVTATAPPLGSL